MVYNVGDELLCIHYTGYGFSAGTSYTILAVTTLHDNSHEFLLMGDDGCQWLNKPALDINFRINNVFQKFDYAMGIV